LHQQSAEYEALLFGLEILQSMEVRHVEVIGDSLGGTASS
jgi:ribonuclease HI